MVAALRPINLMIRNSQRAWKPIVLALLYMAGRAIAEERAVPIPHGTVELVSEQESIQPGHAILLGLHFRLENGWHIYWINPGDSGEPLRLDWHLPAGLRAGAIEWPVPSRLPIPPLLDYGYEGEVLLPVPIENTTGLAAGGEAALAADMKAIVCREVCIPAKAHLSLSLPVRAERPRGSAETAAIFRAARKALPKPAPANWRPSAKDRGDSFELIVSTGRSASEAWFAPLEPLQIENAAPQKSAPATTGVRLILKKSDQLVKPISWLRGVLVLPQSQGAYLIDAPVAPFPAKKPNQE
ncbi:MAG TPA: protein-disulfide reductase DsbD domain-containing protein [Terriglobales bacterium]|nr:protein-disulfide reductase DsbD domain-containing protein [Terriglobales bacterium]